MKAFAIAIFFVAGSAIAAGSPQFPVDLNAPGVLERLKAERPKHYEAVTEILRASEKMPCKESELKILKAKFNMADLACHALLMTSYPAKRRVNFVYDGTSYVAQVSVIDSSGGVVPAKGEAR